MNLKELRLEFVNQSGRYDLVNEAGANLGADFYIRAGQDFLDRLIEQKAEIGRVFRMISTGDYLVTFPRARTIHQVGCGTSDGFIWMERKTSYELRTLFAKPLDQVDRGFPTYYAPSSLREIQPDDPNADGITGYMDVSSNWRLVTGVTVLPPADGDYHLEIWGKFYSEALTSDESESFWTVTYPYLLIMAAQRALEVFYRNTQGVQDWSTAIRTELLEMEKDFIEEQYFGYDQMEG